MGTASWTENIAVPTLDGIVNMASTTKGFVDMDNGGYFAIAVFFDVDVGTSTTDGVTINAYRTRNSGGTDDDNPIASVTILTSQQVSFAFQFLPGVKFEIVDNDATTSVDVTAKYSGMQTA